VNTVDWTGDIGYDQLLAIMQHVTRDADSYLELDMHGIVFKIFPSRITSVDEKERLKKFGRFIRALVRVRDNFEMTITLTSDSMNGTRIGIVGMHGLEWVPCEIDRVELPARPPSFSIPAMDGDVVERTTFSLRKIVL
jgi:hypothetical protein